MAGIVEPGQDKAIAELVEGHHDFENQPLHLAVAIRSPKDPEELQLLEVYDNFGGNRADEDKTLFKVWVAQNPQFTVEGTKNFYLVLTNPTELRVALRESWDGIDELTDGVRKAPPIIYYIDAVGEELWKLVRGA